MGLLVGALLGTGACAAGPDATLQTRTDPAAEVTAPGSGQPLPTLPPVATLPPLPTLPPVATETPQAFDPSGCLRVAGQSECATRASDLDATRAGSAEADWRVLAGFVGERWLDTAGSGHLEVLTDTVTTGMGPSWSAMGLARNETPTAVPGLSVRAELVDTDGSTLAVVQQELPVRGVRPGEPAPFAVTSDIPLTEVAGVRWSVSAGAGTGGSAGRNLDLSTYWQRSPQDARPVDTWLYADDPAAPRPMVVFGGVTNVGTAALEEVGVVGAWLDGSGRVVAVAQARVGAPGQTPATPETEVVLAPGQAADVVLVPAGIVDWAATRLMLWGTSG